MSNRELSRDLAFAGRVAVVLAAGALMTGCPPKAPPPYPFVPMHEAIRRVNRNNEKIAAVAGGLKGSPVDATVRFRERAGAPVRRFSFSGALGFHPPCDMILQLREGLGGTPVMQAGSNGEQYWLWIKPEIDTLWWGTYPKPAPDSAPATELSEVAGFAGEAGTDTPRSSLPQEVRPRDYDFQEMPIRPDDLIEVLGLSVLSTNTAGPEGPVYRPEPTRNVLIFLEYDEVGQGYIQKEYHLDRAPPYLVREVIVRDSDGRERMHAALSEVGPIRGSDAFAAHKIRMEWPSADSWLELRIRRFTLETEPFLSPVNPRDLGVTVRREIRVGSEDDGPAQRSPGGAM